MTPRSFSLTDSTQRRSSPLDLATLAWDVAEIFDCAGAGIVVHDANGTVVFTNRTGASLATARLEDCGGLRITVDVSNGCSREFVRDLGRELHHSLQEDTPSAPCEEAVVYSIRDHDGRGGAFTILCSGHTDFRVRCVLAAALA